MGRRETERFEQKDAKDAKLRAHGLANMLKHIRKAASLLSRKRHKISSSPSSWSNAA
jgi:hypothetical protein